MKKRFHPIPIINYEGRNVEDKEIRHNLYAKLSDIRDIRNNDFEGLKNKILRS